MAARVGRMYLSALKTRPTITNFATGGALGAVGDYVCQRWLEDVPSFDYRRCMAMTAFGVFYSGGVSLMVYNSYRRILPAWFLRSPAREGLGSTVLDNFIHTPFLYTPAFYVSTGLLQGATMKDTVATMCDGYWQSTAACWVMWIPLQAINFSVVPPYLRVAVMNVGCLAWNVLIDYIAQDARIKTGEGAIAQALQAHVRGNSVQAASAVDAEC